MARSSGMGAALAAKDGRLPARCVADIGQPSPTRPVLTGLAMALALALEDCPPQCPGEDGLNIPTEPLTSSMQRRGFPRCLHRHRARQQLILHVQWQD